MSEIRKTVDASPNPYGVTKVTPEEIEVVARAMHEYSKGIIDGQGAKNLAYHALLAVRGHHNRFAEGACAECSAKRGAHFSWCSRFGAPGMMAAEHP